MNKLYRILTWISLSIGAAIISLFPSGLVFGGLGIALDSFNIPEWLKITAAGIGAALVCGGVIYWLWHLLIRTDKESEHGYFSRWANIRLWSAPALLVATFSMIVTWHFWNGWWLFIGLFAVIAALFGGYFSRFRKHRNGYGLGCAGFIVTLAIFLICTMMLPRVGKVVDYSGDNPDEIQYLTQFQKKTFFPPNASDIRINGSTASCNWECVVPEKSFLKYKRNSKFSFRENRSDFNDNPEGPVFSGNQSWAKPYYYYNRRGSNGGGLTLRYSVPEQKFYGSFATH